MNPISFSYLDQLMTKDEEAFFKELGRRIAGLRKDAGLTQVKLAEILGISQQHMAAFEAGRRKVSSSDIPLLAQLFGISTDMLLGVKDKSAKPGPTPKIKRQLDQVALMPKSKQKFISEMLEALIAQQHSA